MAIFDGVLIPEEDGVTHLNVYSKARTKLGRFLSNFAHTPIQTEDGNFASIEGYWYWLKTGDDRLRSLHGFSAKSLGKKLKPLDRIPTFEDKIRCAITAKLDAYPGALRELRATDLPLAHYYVFNGVTRDAGYKWILEHIDSLRKEEKLEAPTVVNLKRSQYDVYIGRAGKGQDGYLGNPVAIGRTCPECRQTHSTGGTTLPCYEKYARRRIASDPHFKERVKCLKGRLGCFCKPQACHGDVLVKLWKELNQ